MTHLTTILSSPSYKGFYVVSGPHPTLDRTQTLEPLYESPVEICGSAQLIPRSKFLGNGVAILNFRLNAFSLDTGNLGKILEPFASSFFSEDGKNLLIFEDIVYDLTQCRAKHEQMIDGIVEKLRAARWVSHAGALVDSRLTVVSVPLSRLSLSLLRLMRKTGRGILRLLRAFMLTSMRYAVSPTFCELISCPMEVDDRSRYETALGCYRRT